MYLLMTTDKLKDLLRQAYMEAYCQALIDDLDDMEQMNEETRESYLDHQLGALHSDSEPEGDPEGYKQARGVVTLDKPAEEIIRDIRGR